MFGITLQGIDNGIFNYYIEYMSNDTHRAFKAQLYEQFARLGKALASPQRLELLDLLTQGERTVEDLAQEASLSVANASQHLRVLYQARLVDTRKAGLYVYYRLADPAVFEVWRALRALGERQLAEIDRLVALYLRAPERLEPLSREELRARLAAGDVLVLDVRPALEYRQGHIAGARSIPITELEARLAELSPTQEIVAYCRGPYCLFSDEAVALLTAHGYRARRLMDGYPEWRAAGLPVEADAAPRA
jgi:rhodanese-related sulfurtransferase